jgi:hypothetical protein
MPRRAQGHAVIGLVDVVVTGQLGEGPEAWWRWSLRTGWSRVAITGGSISTASADALNIGRQTGSEAQGTEHDWIPKKGVE